jgi:drug/metabolite transporter (DMT)-like permease
MFCVVGIFGNQYLYIMAVYHAGVDIAALFSPCVPVVTCMIAISCGIEKMPSLTTLQGCMKLAGIAATVIGALVILLPKYENGHSANPTSKTVALGALCALVGNSCTAVYILCQKRYVFYCKSRWSELPLSVTVWSYFFGAILMAISPLYSLVSCSLLWVVCDVAQYSSFPYQAVIPLIYAVFITSALCYMLLSWCNQNASPPLVSAFFPVQIPGAVLLAYIFLDEQLGFLDWVGGGLITAGLVMAVYSDWHEKHEVTQPYGFIQSNGQ